MVLVDCSNSVNGNQSQWPAEITTIAEEVLTSEGRLRVGCFAGTAGGVHWSTDVRGEEAPKVTGGVIARREYQRKWARLMAPMFREAMRPRGEPGTDWLNALESASETEHLAGVYVFSDLVQQDEGVELTLPQSSSRLKSVAAEWAHRLVGLRNITVRVIGASQGISNRLDRQGTELFDDLERRVDFEGHLSTTVP
ncbi:MAG TPA: hypothetical protein VIJ50_05585 [Solirubrobacteraceae bacterium]